MKELYKGQVNSPSAKLTEKISATATIIKVDNINAFPDGPNLAVIGTDENAETIRYAVKASNALSGCERGVQGTAKIWEKDEKIARNFTQKDHADLIDNVNEINNKIGDLNINLGDENQQLESVTKGFENVFTGLNYCTTILGDTSSLKTTNKETLVKAINELVAGALSIDSSNILKKGNTLINKLRLKNTSNYGGKINFGDGEYVYIEEYTDDKLKIHAKEIRFEGKIETDNYPKKSVTIQTSNWESSTLGVYKKRYKVSDSSIKSTDFVSMSIKADSLEVAEKAGICPTIYENNGFFYIYAINVPTSSIVTDYKVVI